MREVIFLFAVFFSINSFAQKKVNPDLFGFATSNTFTYCNVKDTSFTNKVVAINPQVLRFPGGAVGNFYHFGKKGYGFDFEEIDKYHNGKFPKRSRGLDQSRKKLNQNNDYIDDFIALAKKTNAKAVLVANPFVYNDDIILMIEKLNENNIEVIGVELGSELSNRSYFSNGYTIDDYIEFSVKCSAKIKEQFPEMKTAVVAAPLVAKKSHRHNVWNTKLAELDFYDAIIVHSYAKVTKGKDQYGQMLSEEKEGSEEEAFELYKNRAIDYFKEEYPKEIQTYVSVFEKPIWITEWNLQISKTTGNTMFQSLFVAQYFLELFSSPYLNPIELTTFHNLGGRDFAGSIFRNNKEEMEIQSTYYPMKLIGEIFEKEIVRIDKEVNDEVIKFKCFDKRDKIISTYRIDWNKKEFVYLYNVKEGYEVIIKSDNLFDMADKRGILKLEKTFEFD